MNKNCYLLTGNNHYKIKEKTLQIMTENQIPEEAVEVYDFEEDGLHIALSNALTLPFLFDKKGVVIRNSSFLTRKQKATDEEVNDLIRFCDLGVKETVLVIQGPYDQLDGQKKIVKYLKKQIIYLPLKQDKKFNVYDYVKQELQSHDVSIEPFALTTFVNRIQHDYDSINNEIEKLIAYSKNKDLVNADMVLEITSKDIDDNVFNLVNALLDGNKVKMMDIFNDLLSIKTNEVRIISILSNKYLEILHTKQLIKIGYSQKDIMGYFNVSSGRAYYMKKNADHIEDAHLEKHIELLADLDYRIKSGLIDKRIGLEMFLLKA